MPYSAVEIYPFKGSSSAARGMEKSKISYAARHKEKPTSVLERLNEHGERGDNEGQ